MFIYNIPSLILFDWCNLAQQFNLIYSLSQFFNVFVYHDTGQETDLETLYKENGNNNKNYKLLLPIFNNLNSYSFNWQNFHIMYHFAIWELNDNINLCMSISNKDCEDKNNTNKYTNNSREQNPPKRRNFLIFL